MVGRRQAVRRPLILILISSSPRPNHQPTSPTFNRYSFLAAEAVFGHQIQCTSIQVQYIYLQRIFLDPPPPPSIHSAAFRQGRGKEGRSPFCDGCGGERREEVCLPTEWWGLSKCTYVGSTRGQWAPEQASMPSWEEEGKEVRLPPPPVNQAFPSAAYFIGLEALSTLR